MTGILYSLLFTVISKDLIVFAFDVNDTITVHLVVAAENIANLNASDVS
jgi:hypothetical protein